VTFKDEWRSFLCYYGIPADDSTHGRFPHTGCLSHCLFEGGGKVSLPDPGVLSCIITPCPDELLYYCTIDRDQAVLSTDDLILPIAESSEINLISSMAYLPSPTPSMPLLPHILSVSCAWWH